MRAESVISGFIAWMRSDSRDRGQGAPSCVVRESILEAMALRAPGSGKVGPGTARVCEKETLAGRGRGQGAGGRGQRAGHGRSGGLQASEPWRLSFTASLLDLGTDQYGNATASPRVGAGGLAGGPLIPALPPCPLVLTLHSNHCTYVASARTSRVTTQGGRSLLAIRGQALLGLWSPHCHQRLAVVLRV